MRFDSQLSRMNCHTFSTGFNSGLRGGSGMSVDVVGHGEFGRAMPSGLIEKQDGVGAGRDVESDFRKVHAHGLAVAAGHDDAGTLALGRADRAKDPRRCPALVLWR